MPEDLPRHRVLRPLTALFVLLLPAVAPAQEDPGESAQDAATESPTWPEAAVSRHSVTIGGRTLDYTAEAGTLELTEEQGDVKARMFYTAYTLDGVQDPARRPVTFTFNGGPGSSSVWLHLGAFGPRIVRMDDEGFPLPPPGALADNEFSLLDVTDLVFIDPVTTGYSRAAKGEDDHQYHGFEEDVEAVGELIRLWTTKNERWSSPKFLCGESYGTTRAAGLAGHLQSRHGMYLSGIVLVSSILNFQTARFDVGNDLPHILFLPTFAATAFYHGRLDEELSRDLEATLREVEEFAMGEYTLALMRGSRLSAAARAGIATKLARYTGLSEEYVLATNLRVNIRRFVKELRRDERITVGRLDSRFTGLDRDAAGEGYEFDPSYAAIQGPFTAAANDYFRTELGYENDLAYEILTGRVHPWNYSNVEGRYLNVAETLRGAMARNRDLDVYVANGYYDLATPYFATQYTFDHLSLDTEYSDRVTMAFFPAGHMMYIQKDSLARLKQSIAAFYARALER